MEAAGPTTLLFRTIFFSLTFCEIIMYVHTYLICHFNVNPTADRQNCKTRKELKKLPRKSLKRDVTDGNNVGLQTGFRVINTFVATVNSTGQNVGQLTGSLFSLHVMPIYSINPLRYNCVRNVQK